MGSINNMIQWFKDREGKVSYSQSGRLGPNSYDCSSAVYFALAEGGFISFGSMGWTGSLHDTTLPSIAKKISREECRRGDIFLSKYWANDGHTGVFLDNATIIHCNAFDNNIRTTVADGRMGPVPTEYYRLNNADDENKPDTESEETTMQCIYWRPSQTTAGQNNAYYFDGTSSKFLDHPDQITIIERIYKDNNGKSIPTYHFDGKLPWYTRIEQISGKKPVAGALG
ncbi:hypothetical protein HED39_10585 [Enterococcus casseliflavus]|uniref:peptidoglycan amidohydrolase family protein n=1 Tax=Enterococcus casseliflavus TaxID=37734 RepID=UPI001433326A|nr:peptidoglycan amidohydrolase family protein [Enterococcus casseliflavus]NKD29752.1 hypothetical protein [Enterococcus casseliflavus]